LAVIAVLVVGCPFGGIAGWSSIRAMKILWAASPGRRYRRRNQAPVCTTFDGAIRHSCANSAVFRFGAGNYSPPAIFLDLAIPGWACYESAGSWRMTLDPDACKARPGQKAHAFRFSKPGGRDEAKATPGIIRGFRCCSRRRARFQGGAWPFLVRYVRGLG